MPDSSDTHFDISIPVLDEVLVPGNPDYRRPSRAAEADAAPVENRAAGEWAAADAAAHVPEAEPAEGVTVHSVTHAHVEAFELPEPPAPFELAGAPEPAPFEANSAFHFARAPGPEPVMPVRSLDADVLAERLRGRFANYLTGDGRSVIEARCRDALQDHATWLVNQITREVALALETEMTGWVREAVEEEIGRRSPEH
ncbi:DUF2486 family protein [Paraburkholderia sp.]|uniref:DUF2486 family protein n=1 Tax=Paraburkholderia sp. TaxID=1926495 RepID=UPI00260C75E7|nr:DUF2486 family protein [Paraburkholderia sp.]